MDGGIFCTVMTSMQQCINYKKCEINFGLVTFDSSAQVASPLGQLNCAILDSQKNAPLSGGTTVQRCL